MKKLLFILIVSSFLPTLVLAATDSTDTGSGATGITQSINPDGSFTQTQAGVTPSGAPYQFQRQGIFDCNQNGSYSMSVGALGAIGGAYVPVADAAVELNTGTLVYKECILREVIDREREAALTAFLKQMVNNIQQGRGGNAMYVQNVGAELLSVAADPAELSFLQDAKQQGVDPAILRALAKDYEGETRSFQTDSLVCPAGDTAAMNAWRSGQTEFTFGKFFQASVYSQCDPVQQYYNVQDVAVNRYVAPAIRYQQDQWNWGNGYYARTDDAQNPLDRKTLTPSYVVSQSFQQILGSPVRQLESANDIGQMIGALYAGVTTQVVGDNGGLTGITHAAGGQPSYLEQVAKESAQGLQGAATNAALQILSAAQQVESAFFQAASAILASLSQTQSQLKSAENQCWINLIKKACASPLKADNTCDAALAGCVTDINTGEQTCPQSFKLKVATSTAFSDAVITSKITPLVSNATTNLQLSQTALQNLSGLIQGVTNTASLDAQRVALAQLDNLVVQHKLHTQTNLQTVLQQQQAMADSMSNVLQTTAQAWGGSGVDGNGNFSWDGTTNPGNGWCNINNPDTIAAWQKKWKVQQ